MTKRPAPTPSPAARRPLRRAEPPHRKQTLPTLVIVAVLAAAIASGTAFAFVR
ncbi:MULTISPECIES: hypothetical protein [Actinomadura]|uniref:hypothetical protein n=1 Tax=Actinomadura TaxID=1988 RepID=UPI0031E99EF1